MSIKGIIFDMDGTVVEVPYDWAQIKKELRTEGKSILHFLNALEEPERSAKWKVLERYEKKATEEAVLKEGMQEFLIFLDQRRIKTALVTNNARKNVDYLLNKFQLNFDVIISRESGLWKPSGAPFLEALKRLRIKADETCVVGDSPFDIRAAREAGIKKIFILSLDKEKFATATAEVFPSVDALKKRIEGLILQK